MIITETPLRISLAGGGTDLPDYYMRRDGYVVSTAIDKYVYVIAKERFDDKIYLTYGHSKEIVDEVGAIQHELVREAMRKAGIERGIEVSMQADIPSEGSGLGSSSSVTVGLLNAFYQFQGVQVMAEQLAREACEIEIDICKKPIGKQDQYIAAYGGLRGLHFHGTGVGVERLPIAEATTRRLSERLLLFYTNTTRSSSNILTEQRARILETDVALKDIGDMAAEVRAALAAGRLDEIGALLDRNWQRKKTLASGVSNRAIDDMYARARGAGALGGKVAGAGGGGFLLVYCPLERQADVRAALADSRELPFTFDRMGSRVIFNHRRDPWK